MKHLGDITKINGAEIPPVDCITGGSPCQDLSVAGKREGLAVGRQEAFSIVEELVFDFFEGFAYLLVILAHTVVG